MAQYQMVVQENVTFFIEYTPNNGHVTGFTCVNNSDKDVAGYATLTSGQVFPNPPPQVFPAHTTQTVNIPNNLVTISFDARGEVTWTGLASFNTV